MCVSYCFISIIPCYDNYVHIIQVGRSVVLFRRSFMTLPPTALSFAISFSFVPACHMTCHVSGLHLAYFMSTTWRNVPGRMLSANPTATLVHGPWLTISRCTGVLLDLSQNERSPLRGSGRALQISQIFRVHTGRHRLMLRK